MPAGEVNSPGESFEMRDKGRSASFGQEIASGAMPPRNDEQVCHREARRPVEGREAPNPYFPLPLGGEGIGEGVCHCEGRSPEVISPSAQLRGLKRSTMLSEHIII